MSANGSIAPGPASAARDPRAHAELLAEALRSGPAARLDVRGTSMAPLLLPGDEIEVEARAAGSFRPGEILLLAPRDRRGGIAGFVVHRLLRRTRRGLLVRGDGARSADPLWPEECALAVARARWRGGVRTELPPRRGRAETWRGLLAGRIRDRVAVRLLRPVSRTLASLLGRRARASRTR